LQNSEDNDIHFKALRYLTSSAWVQRLESLIEGCSYIKERTELTKITRLKPTLGIIDPENTRTLPSQPAAASGFDVLCHALESYTALPYNKRSPRPSAPLLRPAYQVRVTNKKDQSAGLLMSLRDRTQYQMSGV